MSLLARLERRLEWLDLPAGPAVVAVSGGPDSVALLDLLTRARAADRLALQVAHLDHGIHPESPAVLELVRRLARSRGLPFHGHRVELGPEAGETRARTVRYQWLEQLADQIGAKTILTAHHRDDQIETVLMRFLHGSGPTGLAGMAWRRGRVARPLLSVSRRRLRRHVRDTGLEFWDDPANRDPRHFRSWIRIDLLPLLRHRVPDIDRRILRLALAAARERAGWDALLDQEPLDLRAECDGISVAASPLSGYDSAVFQALLGALGRRAGCQIGPMRAARIERLLAGGRSGAVAQLGGGCAAELTFGRLRLFREPQGRDSAGAVGPAPVSIETASGSARMGLWRLDWRTEPAPARLERSSLVSWFAPGFYRARPRQPGDRIQPLGGKGRRLVVRCMQDARIARHERAGWPVVETAGTVVWVPGVVRSGRAVPEPGTPSLRIDAHFG